MEGRCKWFSDKKGYGFIETEDKGDVFVYYSDIISGDFKTLDKGEKVEFDIIETEKGLQAQNVKRLGGGQSRDERDRS